MRELEHVWIDTYAGKVVAAPAEAAASAAAFARPCRASIGAFWVAFGRVSSDSSSEGGAALGSIPYAASLCGGGANPGRGGNFCLGQIPGPPPSPDEEGRAPAPALLARWPPAPSGERCLPAAVEEKREVAEDGGPSAVEVDGTSGYTVVGFWRWARTLSREDWRPIIWDCMTLKRCQETKRTEK
jgi:hypothetical protein